MIPDPTRDTTGAAQWDDPNEVFTTNAEEIARLVLLVSFLSPNAVTSHEGKSLIYKCKSLVRQVEENGVETHMVTFKKVRIPTR